MPSSTTSRRRRRRSETPDERVGSRLRVRLESVAFGGECIARHEGQIVFADFGIPGEEVTVEIEEAKKDYLRGAVVEVHEPSPDRVAPPCPYFGRCGGCQWQHVSYERQLALKREVVREQLGRIGRFWDLEVLPVAPSPKQWGYRNHLRFTAKPRGELGFVTRPPHRRFLRIDECLIAHPLANEALERLQGRGGGLHQVQVRASDATGDYLVQPGFPGLDLAFETGQKGYREALGGREFLVSASSFFQVNREQAENLAALAVRALGPEPSHTVVDAYAGVGVLAALAAPHAERVIAIEEAPAAVENARANLADLANVEVILGKVEEVLPGLQARVDGILLDPPRQGCTPAVLEAILEHGAPNVVYVSCDPATLARDLRILVDGGYRVEPVQPLDMFPQTYHIETIAPLRRG